MLCNTAELSQGGLVYVLGGFIDSLAAESLPARVTIWFVGRMTLEGEEVGETHAFTVACDNSDGEEVASVSGLLMPPPEIDRDQPGAPEHPRCRPRGCNGRGRWR
jgi:hypothetical protein